LAGQVASRQAGHGHIILLTGSGLPGAGTTGRPRGREVAAPPPPLPPPALPRTRTKALVAEKAAVAAAAAGAGAQPPAVRIRTPKGLRRHRASAVSAGAGVTAAGTPKTGRRSRAGARRNRRRFRRCLRWCWPLLPGRRAVSLAAAVARRCRPCSGGAGGRGPVPCGPQDDDDAAGARERRRRRQLVLAVSCAEAANADGGRPMGVAVRPEQRHHPLMPPPLRWPAADTRAGGGRCRQRKEKKFQGARRVPFI
jgi:hypothetical protein